MTRNDAQSGSRTAIVAVLIAVLLLAAGRPAAGTEWSEEAGHYRGWKVTALEIRGLKDPLAARLQKGLALNASSRLIFGSTVAFQPRLLEEDLSRSRLWLSRQGYPRAQVDPVFLPQRRGRRLALRLDVDPGPPTVIDSVAVTGLPAGTTLPVPSPIGIDRGQRFVDDQVLASEKSLLGWLRSAGHADARVETAVTPTRGARVRVDFQSEPGPVFTMDSVAVSGAPPDLRSLVVRTVDLEPGTRYSPRFLERSQESLRLLDLFRRIQVTTVKSGPTTRAVQVNAVPKDFRSLELGVGYWTDDELKGRALWRHRNLLRGGRGAQVEGSFSRFLQTAGASVWWPALPLPRSRTSLSADGELQNEDSYDLRQAKLELAVVHRYSPLTTLRAGVALSRVRLNAKTQEETPDTLLDLGGNLLTTSLQWVRESTDDRFYPTRGTVTSSRVEWVPPGFASDAHYLRTTASASAYLGLARNTVLASRLGIGYAFPTRSGEELLVSERFYAGGATSMRGFKRHRLGPKDATGTPLGGEVLLEAGLELRVPLFWRLRAAVFGDAGQVWRHREDVDLGEIEFAVGPGLMVMTPIGPIRADLGYRLTNFTPHEPVRVFHIAIGQPF